MKKQKNNSNGAFRSPLIRSLLFVAALIASQLLACNGTEKQTRHRMETDSTASNANTETFQELGFFGDIKKDKWNDFVHAVQNNIMHSRMEQGNLSFSLYQPADGKLQPIWFERFESKKAHNYHKEQSYFKNAISVIQQSLAGEAKSITLKVLDEIPAKAAINADRPEIALHVIVLFNVKPEKKKAFLNAMAEAAPQSRKAQGNLEFNLYKYADDPNKFVLIEGWESRDEHETQLKQNHIKQLSTALDGLFLSNPMDMRWIVKDISQ